MRTEIDRMRAAEFHRINVRMMMDVAMRECAREGRAVSIIHQTGTV